ncbi:MAG: XdhC family protein [Gammaproteobacteria bacterium]
MKRELFRQLLADRAAKRSVALVTLLESGAQWLVYPHTVAGDLPVDLADAARRLLREDRSAVAESAAGKAFVEVFNTPLRLIIVGAVHIAQALVPMARSAGYQVIVIDPRRAWTSETRFPDVEITDEWPDDAMRRLAPDRRTAVVTLTHDPKLDDPALHVALRSQAFYVGSLGSRKTHAGRVARLKEAGFTDAEIARIHAPIGLDIGAESPAEIALAILAQVVQVLHAEPA